MIYIQGYVTLSLQGGDDGAADDGETTENGWMTAVSGNGIDA